MADEQQPPPPAIKNKPSPSSSSGGGGRRSDDDDDDDDNANHHHQPAGGGGEQRELLSTTNWKWVFRGNIVVPTGNPFHVQQQQHDDQHEHPPAPPAVDDDDPTNSDTNSMITWLGPGLKLLRDHVLTVDAAGRIQHVEPAESFLSKYCTTDDDQQQNCYPRIQRLDPRLDFLCPGFIDTHLHAPQFAYSGTGTDRPLMGENGWLERYAFPAERRLRDDPELARTVYDACVSTTLRNGTTTAVYFCTLDAAPTRILVDCCRRLGQRALIGKVCMDRNAPDDCVQSVQQNVQEAEDVIRYIYRVAGQMRKQQQQQQQLLPLILPLITPRFVPTCSPELLSALGRLAARHGDDCHITTHASESLDEVAYSRHLDATQDLKDGVGRTDAEILDSHGLLTHRTILAHAVHLTPSDERLLRERGAAVAHCPLSNFFFAGGCLPCRQYMQQQRQQPQEHHDDASSSGRSGSSSGSIKVGLGTDVAGGYSPSMLHAQRLAVVVSRAREQLQQQKQQQQQKTADNSNDDDNNENDDDDNDAALDYRHAFYLATLGGAEALGLQDRIGTLAVGMEFDALVLSAQPSPTPTTPSSPVTVFDTDTAGDIFQKLCNLGDDRNVKRVFVRGREVVTEHCA